MKKNTAKKILNHVYSHQKGASFVEFSLSFTWFILAVFSSIYLLYYLYKISALQYVSNLAVRSALIESRLEKDLFPNYRIAQKISEDAHNWGIKILTNNVTSCPYNNPECIGVNIIDGQFFITRIEAQQDYFSRKLGLRYVVWVAGINSDPVSITEITR